MRHFHSYGPVDCRYHFCVQRTGLIAQGVEQLVGIPEQGGHYFTIWAPRQTGKTWLMRQLKKTIAEQYPEQFALLHFSLGGLRGVGVARDEGTDAVQFPTDLGELVQECFPGAPSVAGWKDLRQLFSKEHGIWDQPLILLIDEVDTLPPLLLDALVAQFRELYLARENNHLHGLALVGVRAVLGIESRRGSPFNIQKSLHVPNFSFAETAELYRQYQEESGQEIDPQLVEKVHRVTNGQPGLVSWFGELLTETYNPGPDRRIGPETWEMVWHKARFAEPNNTVMNLIAKARIPEYQPFLLNLFSRSDLPFSFHDPICNYLYLHGIIISETIRNGTGELTEICSFSSPFIQTCLYHALSREILNDRKAILALPPLDDLADVFSGPQLDLPALLQRYKDYLYRLKEQGVNPWKEQPRRRADLHLTEAVGHFHLFSWLQEAITRRCVVSPEFPTGNGRVDIHLRCDERRGIIEVKSFTDRYQIAADQKQAAEYSADLGLDSVTVALFIPVLEEDVLKQLSSTEVVEGVTVSVIAIGWM
ncbi:hypothetical protein [Candidatus Electrothrix sp.]|uniref:hypothetical protein n=1 Tax=Candidatus Electrothrix sp. TaxID=2170559 RepID=UPI0040559DD4